MLNVTASNRPEEQDPTKSMSTTNATAPHDSDLQCINEVSEMIDLEESSVVVMWPDGLSAQKAKQAIEPRSGTEQQLRVDGA